MFPVVREKELQARWKNLGTCVKRESGARMNAPSAEDKRKCRQWLYFGQLLFLLRCVEDRATESNLSSASSNNE
jgi:hypothetical protein